MTKIAAVTSADFEKAVMCAKVPVIVVFVAIWCGPCRMILPELEALADKYPNAKFLQIDVDDEPDLAIKYDVISIPLTIVFNDGLPVYQIRGYRSRRLLAKDISLYLQ